MSEHKVLKEARHNRDICDIIYNEQYTLLESSLINSHSIQVILKNKDGLQNKLAELEKAHRQVLILSKDTEDSKWVTSRQEKFNKIISDVELFISNEKLKSNKISTDQNFKLEKLPLPIFDGNIRNYARFK